MQNYYCQTTLTPLQTQQITELIHQCRQAEPLRLTFPKDGDLFLFTGKELPPSPHTPILSCLIVCKVQPTLWECYAFTRPDCRKQGLFSHLLEKLCQITPEDTELVFLLDHQSPDALAAVQAMEMEHWQTEYQMEQTVTPSHRQFPLPPNFSLRSQTITENGENQRLFSAFLLPKAEPALLPGHHNHAAPLSANHPTFSRPIPLGSCRILAYDELHLYLHHVEISHPFRNQGWGTIFIRALLSQLPENTSVSLQVSAENTAAVKLYKKTGFHLTETLSYYFY